MNKVSSLILLAGVLLLAACSETTNNQSNKQSATPANRLGVAPNVNSEAIPAVFVDASEPVAVPESVEQAVAEPSPAAESSFSMSAKDETRFNRYDADGDGGISLDEFTETLTKHFEDHAPDKNKDASVIGPKRFHQQDSNADGALSPEEFLTKRKK